MTQATGRVPGSGEDHYTGPGISDEACFAASPCSARQVDERFQMETDTGGSAPDLTAKNLLAGHDGAAALAAPEATALVEAASGLILAANAAFVALTGHDPAEIRGRRFSDLAPAGEEAALMQALDEANRDGVSVPARAVFRRNDGAVAAVTLTVCGPAGAGLPDGVLVVQAAAAGEDEQRTMVATTDPLFRALFDSAAVGMVLLDAETRILDINP
jgi:PAS domain S-box-containing protein